ncbi:transporter substrate-binding domain-containing protein [Terasakiella sp. A23]|uniref:transporter substrate-binding domain-containing protein n=1 Tax=Terasakiella sp. FCG-A23 TaxID=3080561 RepID=UPI002952C20C|nr:transporter substrate-binding domain-containing protein [Terasakiella sp. A23]MDV7338459.1 transporter substrate-binding domain-containing protein [Terasakiella sp. A23]
MKQIIPALLGLILSVTSAEARDWDEITKSGTLNVGVRPAAQVVYRPASPEKPGMMYEMVQDFAKLHGLKINLVEIPSFSTYWKQNPTDKALSKMGTPGIYDQIDVAAEIFTVTDARKSRIHMSPYLENVELFFAQKGKRFQSYEDLIGQSILTYESMSFYGLLINELHKHNLPYRQTYVTPLKDKVGTFELPANYKNDPTKINLLTFPKDTKARATMSYQPVASGIADIGINDAVGVLYRVFEVGQFKDKLRPLFPAQPKRSELAWGSRHEDKMLNQKIAEFMVEDKKSGQFSKRLERYIGMSFEDYQSLIQMFD